MALDRSGYVFITVLTFALLAGCTPLQVPLGGGEELAADAARRVMVAYRVTDLLAQADTILTDTLLESLPDNTTTARRERLRQDIASVFAAESLVTALTAQLKQQALATDHVSALVAAASALETPLARRLLGLQAQVGTDGFAARYNAYARQPPRADRRARLRQIRVLMQAMGTIDLHSAFHGALLQTMLNTRNEVAQPALSQAAIAAKLADNRRMLRSQLQEQLPPILLYVYRDVSDADLRNYVEMQQSKPLTWTNQVLAGAIRNVLEHAGRQLQKKVREP